MAYGDNDSLPKAPGLPSPSDGGDSDEFYSSRPKIELPDGTEAEGKAYMGELNQITNPRPTPHGASFYGGLNSGGGPHIDHVDSGGS